MSYMKNKTILNFAKFLISLSFVFITYGLAQDIEKNNFQVPTEKTYIMSSLGNTKTISITTLSDDSYKEKNNEQKINANQTNQKDNTNLSIDDANNNLRNMIKNNYGIDVKYGEETKNYKVAGLETYEITDKNMINQSLNNLNYNMSLYPANFFSEIKNYGFTLTIYLINNYSQNNVTGITDSTNNNVIISLATAYSFTESFHHEIYHYIEKYIYAKGGRYTTWNNLNPINFKYGKIDTSLSYSTTQNISSYFVNSYAQTDEEEDRASTFEYMTAENKEACFIGTTPIKLKAKAISEQINATFSSVTQKTTEYWERYVY